jgi:hypothetical protein
MREATLARFCYVDGTTFYLAQGEVEAADKEGARLGPFVWRMANGKDGLYSDNVGPSLYASSQGQPIKIWGFFANAKLSYMTLPADGTRATNMTIERYVKMIEGHFVEWAASAFGKDARLRPMLIQDHERCLWAQGSQAAIAKAGFDLMTAFPKSSPDLNAIEGVWAKLRDVLNARAPSHMETRSAFLVRLNHAVRWLNENRKVEMRALCFNQRARAKSVVELKGARNRW